MAAWVLAFIFYMYIRITKTMDLGQYLAYGIYVLVVEVTRDSRPCARAMPILGMQPPWGAHCRCRQMAIMSCPSAQPSSPSSSLNKGPSAVVQVFGASATALYGINLLLNPVPPEQYKLHPEVAGSRKQKKAGAKPAKQQKKRWWRRKGKGEAKDAESSDTSDADTGIDSKVSLLAVDRHRTTACVAETISKRSQAQKPSIARQSPALL